MNDPAKILIIRLKSLGDVVFTLPAVNLIQDNFPNARLTFLTSKENASIIGGFEAVDEIIGLDRVAFRRLDLRGIYANSVGLAARLRQQKFSVAIDLQGYCETALITWLTRAPQRWGSVYRAARAWAYTRGVTRKDSVHPAEWNLALLHQCGLGHRPVRNEFRLPESELQSARAFFVEHRYDLAKLTIYIQPFTSSPHKNWPLEKYLALALHWRKQGVQVIFGGGPSDRSVLEPMHAAGFPVSAGVPLLTTAGLMKLSTLVVGGDTGALHLAVAMDKRVVMVMNSNQPENTHPFGHPEWVVIPQVSQPGTGVEADVIIQAAAQAFAELGVSLPASHLRLA